MTAVKCQASSLLGRLDLVALQLLPGDSRQKKAQAQATREGWQDGQCISAQVILQHIQTDWSENQIFEGSNMLKYYGCSASHLLSPSFPQRSFPQPVLPPPCSTPRIWEHITGRLRADKWGDNVTSATMRGDGWRTRHDGLKHTIKDLHCKSEVQGCYRVLVSLISWPGQLLSLNPCWRPKILARMLFLRILSLTVVIADVTA